MHGRYGTGSEQIFQIATEDTDHGSTAGTVGVAAGQRGNSMSKTFARIAILAGAAAIALLGTSSIALAGSCPADKQMADATKPTDFAAKGVVDTVIGAIDLSKEPAMVQDRKLRLRKLTIQPGGIVPWHSHGDRPAIIYVVSGSVTEYASNCAVPIVHAAGDVAMETHVTAHWWKNTGKKTAVLLSADLLHDASDHNM
jgi:quercetin dioxygenase-like cupin family protein